jgi:hypothetical protein
MRLLVTGCGRSGTMWTAAALSSAGIDCGHERAFTPGYPDRPARWGTGWWTAEVSGHAAPFTPLPDTYVVRLVRHPINVVTSIIHRRKRGQFGRDERAREFIEKHAPGVTSIEDPIERAATYWVRWNRLVVADETLRLEDIDQQTVIRLARIINDQASLTTLPPRLNRTRRAVQPIRWRDIKHVPGLVDAMREYGYKT